MRGRLLIPLVSGRLLLGEDVQSIQQKAAAVNHWD
jgi:hypothetical protein